MNIDKWLGPNTVYVVMAGSHAYGTSTPESDYDYRGAAIPPKNYFFGLDNFEQADGKGTAKLVNEGLKWSRKIQDDADITIWSLKKMIKLAADGNPNVRREV